MPPGSPPLFSTLRPSTKTDNRSLRPQDHQYRRKTRQSHKTHTKINLIPSRWFSQLTFSTQPQRLRLASTSLRTSCPPPDPSSWTSSAPVASPSPPSSPTHKPSSSALDARLFSANLQVERLV